MGSEGKKPGKPANPETKQEGKTPDAKPSATRKSQGPVPPDPGRAHAGRKHDGKGDLHGNR